MEPLYTSPHLIVALDGSAVTEDGLVVKNVLNAERIHTQNDVRVEAKFVSWQISRLVRRDFNFVATKSFHRGAGRGKLKTREQLRDLMTDLRMQAEFFVDDVSDLIDDPAPELKIVPLRLFTHFVGGLYRTMVIADRAYGRLNFAYNTGKVTQEDYRAYTRNFENSWGVIKAFLNNAQSNKTAQELGADQGIA
jgi:hypothetical protein